MPATTDDRRMSVLEVAAAIADIVTERLGEVVAVLGAVSDRTGSPELLDAVESLTAALAAAEEIGALLRLGCAELLEYPHRVLVVVDGGGSLVRGPDERLGEYGRATQQLALLISMDEETALTGTTPRTRGRWLTSPTGKPEQRDSGHDAYSAIVRENTDVFSPGSTSSGCSGRVRLV